MITGQLRAAPLSRPFSIRSPRSFERAAYLPPRPAKLAGSWMKNENWPADRFAVDFEDPATEA